MSKILREAIEMFRDRAEIANRKASKAKNAAMAAHADGVWETWREATILLEVILEEYKDRSHHE